MSIESAKAFFDKVKSDEELAKKVKGMSDFNACIEMAKTMGYEFTEAELKQVNAELTEADLDNVNGGLWALFEGSALMGVPPINGSTIAEMEANLKGR